MNLQDLDKQVLWHPYTQMHDYASRDLLLIDRALGIKLYDQDGREYYDTISSWWCILHGHGHPTIREAIHGQLDRLEQVLLAGTTHEPAIRLAEQLVEITQPPLTRVFFSDNGSCACEIAIKMSLQYWQQTGRPQRKELVALTRGYHGDTIGTMSLGGVPEFHQAFGGLMFPSHRLPSPYCYRCPMHREPRTCDLACLDPLAALLEKQGDRIAALIVEPLIQAAGGMIIYPTAYLTRLAAMTTEFGVHLILDEVATGFGRTGTMFAMEQAGVEPDFLCLSKGLTGGFMPLAATMATEEVFQAFYAPYQENQTFYHGHTFTGNPLGCAAGLGSLQVFAEEATMVALPTKIDHFHRGMERFRTLPWVGDLRKLGMIAALELVMDKESKEPFAFEDRVGWALYLAGLNEGLLLRPLGNVIYLWLPLSTTTTEIDDILERTWRVLADPANLPFRHL
ncbi:MAG: adenosylmethionine--8-amino-7-oxononanoate transaminase [Proteobacteria bacterium]|nr:adenosylmethionine--8-amino-7-oxononanoate transaminase [Pseudomonadota bacterium]MBU1687626.1 adenosylmethionine--8-amino-7-oxononanoate transaminase [Pseudomonadota bacterium]